MRRARISAAFAFVVALSAVAVALAGRAEKSVNLPFGAWTRASETPILSPQGTTWESAGTFNPAVVLHNGKVVMLYRAQDPSGTSRLGYAESTDGIHFTRRNEPVLSPATDYEKDGGVEDPRLQKFGDTYYLTYTGYNKRDAQLCLATSRDLFHWERKGVILPAYKGNWNKAWTKSGAIVPEKIDGKYWMYWLGTAADNTDQMGLSYSTDLIHWTEATETPVLPKRPGMFDSRVVEPGPPPILTSSGIVLIYNGADDSLVYRTGLAVFDTHDPRKVLYRSDTPIFSPEKEWEKIGQVPNVVFVEGMIRMKDRWLFYYGGADKYVGVAEAHEPQDSGPSSTPSQSPSSEGEVFTFPSGELTLHGVLFRPEGDGPFPAVVYNHGSAPGMLSKGAFDALGPVFAKHGWVFFGPYRRGQGLSASTGKYIGDEIAAATKIGGITSGAATWCACWRRTT
ncbi:MAG TPA: family 43 glycosylhydrolase [Candidatus Acidoferrum sp.]|nr:family 43 glycosylhydrolase [Candidatus Acidoferrum sp.]